MSEQSKLPSIHGQNMIQQNPTGKIPNLNMKNVILTGNQIKKKKSTSKSINMDKFKGKQNIYFVLVRTQMIKLE
jgi:hypothetical protein